ncbi:MAG: hypothetical protein Q9P44_16050 [Anaerolineae bacterium]|nr:hypothetical protein [Anaerolineae bacterium]
MAQHLICLTIDTDPDGLNTHDPDRRTLTWDGLHFAMQYFHTVLPHIPLTWYVRADGQLEQAYGSARYLLDKYADFWRKAIRRGDELGWHPHLYTLDAQPQLITDSAQAVAELARIWHNIQDTAFNLPTFRMGEAWHTTETLTVLAEMGFTVDSTAIPQRDDSASGHPRNWSGTPNHPYFPAQHDIRMPAAIDNIAPPTQRILEVPMNSWYIQASYDAAPKLRYMNPCIHRDLWQQGLVWWDANLPNHDLHVWNLILHPTEAMPHEKSDLLYAYSLDVLQENLAQLLERIEKRGDSATYVTLSHAAQHWRQKPYLT